MALAISIKFVFCESGCVSPDKEMAKLWAKLLRNLQIVVVIHVIVNNAAMEKICYAFFPNVIQHKLRHSGNAFDDTLVMLCWHDGMRLVAISLWQVRQLN